MRALGALTDRQAEIAGYVSEGLSNRQIAARMFLSESTIKNHLHAIYCALGYTQRSSQRVLLAKLVWEAEAGS